jgi:hypothetical protein
MGQITILGLGDKTGYVLGEPHSILFDPSNACSRINRRRYSGAALHRRKRKFKRNPGE